MEKNIEMLNDLKELLKKHNIGFVRSASNFHELVLVQKIDNDFIEYTFDEECEIDDIENERFSIEKSSSSWR